MDIRLLGPVRAYAGGEAIDLGPRKQRFVLAVLALEINQFVPLERLVELTWPQSPPRTAVHAVRVCASRLRSVLVDAADPAQASAGHDGLDIIGQGGGYVLRADPHVVDAHRFRSLTTRARTADVDDAARLTLLDRALALWTGPALADSAPPEVSERLCRGLEEARLHAVEDRLDIRLRLGQHREIVDELTDLVQAYPERERLAGLLMLALHRAGRTTDALATYKQVRRRLADEFGLDPGSELRQLEIAILRGDGDTGAVDPPTDAPADVPAPTERPADVPRLLPPAVAGFVGRTDEIKVLDAHLDEHRERGQAVTIMAIGGTAGVGKTALATHWAHRVADQFPDGQLYVNLRGFDAAGSAVPAAEAVRRFLDALGVPAGRIPASAAAQADLYRSRLAGRRLLVLLDNAATVDQIRPLLPGTPGCLVLITSRNQLTSLVAVEGARPLTLDLLSTEDAERLLAHRLGEDRLAIDPAAVRSLVASCARLPLALAVVAARAAMAPAMPLSTFAAELRSSTTRGASTASAGVADLDQFDAGDPSADVRTVFSWSYRSLSAPAARLFRLLSLHPGPEVSAAAAESLDGTSDARRTLGLLTELRRANLLTGANLVAGANLVTGANLVAGASAAGRHTFHDLLRAYAEERCAVEDTDAERHRGRARIVDHFLHSASAATRVQAPLRDRLDIGTPLPGVVVETPDSGAEAIAWFDRELPMLLATIELASAYAFEKQAWQLAWAVTDHLDRRGRWHDWIAAQETAAAAARRIGDRFGEATANRSLGPAYALVGRYDDAQASLSVALARYAELGHAVGQARSHHNLSGVYEAQGRHTEMLAHTEQALGWYRACGDRVGEAAALNAVGWSHALLGDHRRTLEYCVQALAVQQELGDRMGEAGTWDSIGYAHHHLGDQASAVDCYRHSLAILREQGDRYNEADVLVHLGDAHEAGGDPVAAREAWRLALRIYTDLGHAGVEQVRARLEQPYAALT